MNPYNLITSADLAEYKPPEDEFSKIQIAANWASEVKARFSGKHTAAAGVLLPWAKTHLDIALRPGEVSIWAGTNGHGKSMLLGQVMTGCVAQGQGVMIASMEMKPAATVARMCRQASQTDQPSDEFVDKYCAWAGMKLWLYDQMGTVKGHTLLKAATFAADKLEVKHIVIDSLMKCGMDETGERGFNDQKRFVDELCSLARDWNVHVHLVAHSRKKEDEHTPTGKMDVKGSGAITDQVDNVFIVWRNKKNEHSPSPDPTAPDAMLICEKQRHGEAENRYKLWFHKESQQYLGDRADHPTNLINWGMRRG